MVFKTLNTKKKRKENREKAHTYNVYVFYGRRKATKNTSETRRHQRNELCRLSQLFISVLFFRFAKSKNVFASFNSTAQKCGRMRINNGSWKRISSLELELCVFFSFFFCMCILFSFYFFSTSVCLMCTIKVILFEWANVSRTVNRYSSRSLFWLRSFERN